MWHPDDASSYSQYDPYSRENAEHRMPPLHRELNLLVEPVRGDLITVLPLPPRLLSQSPDAPIAAGPSERPLRCLPGRASQSAHMKRVLRNGLATKSMEA